MAKHKSQSTPNPSKNSKKEKISIKRKVFDEKNFKVRVILPSSSTSDKGKINKSPKILSTLTVNKGKKIVAKSPKTVVKRKETQLKTHVVKRGRK